MECLRNRRLPLLLLVLVLFAVSMEIFSSATAATDGSFPATEDDPTQTQVVYASSVAPVLSESTAPDLARIIEAGKLVVATTITDQPPMFWENEEGCFGVDYDLAKGVADALGVELEILRYTDDYSQLQNAVLTGEADLIIASYSNSLSRALTLAFSDPYLCLNYGVMTNSSTLVQHDIEADPVGYMLENPVTIGVLGGSSHAQAVQALFPTCEVIEIFLEEGDTEPDAYDKAAQMVARGELFAYFCVEQKFIYQYLTYPDLSVYTTTFTFTDVSDTYAVGLNREDEGLRDFVNIYISQNPVLSASDYMITFVEQGGQGA